MTPEQELKLLTERLKIAGKGIIPLHDPAQTAAMLPAFLRYSARTIIAWSILSRPGPRPARRRFPNGPIEAKLEVEYRP
jgi:hypothetical protein